MTTLKPLARCLLLTLLFASLLAAPASAAMQLLLPRSAIGADELALLINDDDPLSRQTGEYYRQARRIPAANVIHVNFAPGRSALTQDEFAQLKAQIDRATPAHVQAYAVAWTAPYRVGCMSLTSALAFGFDDGYCSATCGPTTASAYFNSPSQYPMNDHRLRPAMMLAGASFEQVRALSDRGVAADGQFPDGRAYLLTTPDKARSVRAHYFELTARELAGVFPIEVLETTAIENRRDVLFYFTGLVQVPHLETLRFQPGALADHLTSTGGQLTDSSQMSSLRWLEAGATASYGTVVEPCNHAQKFPFPGIAMYHYANGASAIEAYWKSVAWPGEGVFIGEPLARPFAPTLKQTGPGDYRLTLFSAQHGEVRIDHAASAIGPFAPTAMRRTIVRGRNVLRLSFAADASGFFRIRIVSPPGVAR